MSRACADTADAILRQLPGGRATAVAFTSPGDGDGKTSLLIALAPQLATRVTGSILVVDANFRRPSLTAQLKVPTGEPDARSVLIYPTSLPRLSVLPASENGQSRSLNPAWIKELREGWPLVLLDMASLVHPEAAPLLQCCDGVYLVVRLGYTPRRAVAEAAQIIHGAGGRLLGCVMVG
jgi:Mrp family chromosome partitioning ATPase